MSTKVALLTDTHFGMRQDSPIFLDFQERFFKEVFFPKIDELGIKTVIHLGDVVDRRKYINFLTLKRMKEMYFDQLKARDIWSPTILGNHDVHFKNTNSVNSQELLLQEYTNVQIINEPQIVDVHGFPILMIPWICPENEQACFDMLATASTDLCMGHFSISGFLMHTGMVSEAGLDRNVFDRFDMVLSGHYHHRSSDGRIWYLGNPSEMTWQDFADWKGFHIFDLETRQLTFIVNPNQMFHRIIYNDETPFLPDVHPTPSTIVDFSQYTGAYVKVVVEKKNIPELWETFINNLYNVNPFSVSVVQNYADVFELPGEFVPDQADSTLSMLHKFIDGATLSDGIEADALKSLFTEIYNEAINLE